MFFLVLLVFAVIAAGAYAITQIDRLFRSLEESAAFAARQRDTHANRAMKEDVGMIAYRLLLEEKKAAEERQIWLDQIGAIVRESLPGPYAYDPDRESGIIL